MLLLGNACLFTVIRRV
ncbi:hypothetical protein QQF64_034107, partial [Cirrhinus molitorella]